MSKNKTSKSRPADDEQQAKQDSNLKYFLAAMHHSGEHVGESNESLFNTLCSFEMKTENYGIISHERVFKIFRELEAENWLSSLFETPGNDEPDVVNEAFESVYEENEKFFSTETLDGQMRRWVYELWRQHKDEGLLPTSARFLYYELVAAEKIQKDAGFTKDGKKKRTDQRLISALTALREKGYIPWEDIVDETRSVTGFRRPRNLKEAVENTLRRSHVSLWLSQSPPIVICESRSLLGSIRDLCEEYQVPAASTNGACNGFLRTKLKDEFEEYGSNQVLYLGDWDFSGGQIEDNSKRVLEDVLGRDLIWERIAVTEDQVQEFGLTVVQKYDERTKSTHDAVETEALGQARIIGLLRMRMSELMPDVEIEAVKAAEEIERHRLAKELRIKLDED